MILVLHKFRNILELLAQVYLECCYLNLFLTLRYRVTRKAVAGIETIATEQATGAPEGWHATR